MPEVSNPAGPAGGIPDGLSGAFDKAISDLGLDAELDAAPEVSGDPVQEIEEHIEEGAPAEEGEPVRQTRQEQPRVAKPAPRQQPKPEPAAEPVAEPATAPEGFDAERSATFAKLPPEAQNFVRELHNDYVEQANALGAWANYARQVRSLITDEHRQAMVKGGFKNEVEAIAHLIQLNELATTDFPRYVRWAIGQYGNGDLAGAVRAIFPEVSGDVDTEYADVDEARPSPRQMAPDPVQRQVLDTLGNVVRRLDGIDGAARDQRLRAADQVIAAFRIEKDAQGQPKYPYLKEVEKVVARIVRQPEYKAIADLRERLGAAYDAAVALVPSVRAKSLAAERAKWEKDQRQKADVARARKAKSIVSSPTVGPTGKQSQGLDAAISLAMNQLGV